MRTGCPAPELIWEVQDMVKVPVPMSGAAGKLLSATRVTAEVDEVMVVAPFKERSVPAIIRTSPEAEMRASLMEVDCPEREVMVPAVETMFSSMVMLLPALSVTGPDVVLMLVAAALIVMLPEAVTVVEPDPLTMVPLVWLTEEVAPETNPGIAVRQLFVLQPNVPGAAARQMGPLFEVMLPPRRLRLPNPELSTSAMRVMGDPAPVEVIELPAFKLSASQAVMLMIEVEVRFLLMSMVLKGPMLIAPTAPTMLMFPVVPIVKVLGAPEHDVQRLVSVRPPVEEKFAVVTPLGERAKEPQVGIIAGELAVKLLHTPQFRLNGVARGWLQIERS